MSDSLQDLGICWVSKILFEQFCQNFDLDFSSMRHILICYPVITWGLVIFQRLYNVFYFPKGEGWFVSSVLLNFSQSGCSWLEYHSKLTLDVLKFDTTMHDTNVSFFAKITWYLIKALHHENVKPTPFWWSDWFVFAVAKMRAIYVWCLELRKC